MESSDSAADWNLEVAQEHAALFSAIFGDSDTDTDLDSDLKEEDEHCTEEEGYVWEKVEDVEGLWHCSNFLSVKQQESLLVAINEEGWFCDPLHNQAMRFGDLPRWAKDLSALINSSSGSQRSVKALDQNSNHCSESNWSDEFRENGSPFPSRILDRKPLFDQMIVNSYQPGEGIAAHVDLLRFEDGIAIVSLESSCIMSFRVANNPLDGVESKHTEDLVASPHGDPSQGSGNGAFGRLEASGKSLQSKGNRSKSYYCERDPISGIAKRVDVLLNPGDLIIAHGPARYNWTHEINRNDCHQSWQGVPIVQRHRISVTLRRLCPQET